MRRDTSGSTGDDAGEWSDSLVPIQPDGSRPPIYGVHGLGVNLAFYRPLAQRLGPDQPVFGLWRLPDARRGGIDDESAADLATGYADEVERHRPDGPLVLAAVSSASVVAVELAQQLIERGRHVALLVLFDAIGPDRGQVGPGVAERVLVHARRLARHPADWAEGVARKLRVRIRRRADIAQVVARRALRVPLGDRLTRRAIIEANVARERSYHHRPYPGRVLVLKAGNDPYARTRARSGMGWRRIVTGRLDVEVVPGSHLSMLAEPQVAHLAERLGEVLDDALAAAGRGDGTGGP